MQEDMLEWEGADQKLIGEIKLMSSMPRKVYGFPKLCHT